VASDFHRPLINEVIGRCRIIILLQNDIIALSVAQDLTQTLGRLRRGIRQRTRQEWGASPLPEAQLELVRLVEAEPGIRPREAAKALGVLPNTVSTLVKSLEGIGLLERQRDATDARCVRMHLTAAAVARIADSRDQRQAVVAAALDTLDPADRAAIASSLPALGRLAHALGTAPH
jgi:DNA-binding MarR family transcriptional regulator